MLSIQTKLQLAKLFVLNFLLLLLFLFSFVTASFAQKKINPTIGKNELEVSLFLHSTNSPSYSLLNLISTQMVYRWPWQKNTKFGVGCVAGVIDSDPIHRSDVVAYGTLFGDITQFIDHRQKWSASGQAGHGIFKRKNEFQTATYKGVDKHTAGMYYSISINYRPIISKKVLIVISPVYTFINFRQKSKREIYSPSSVEEYTLTSRYSGPGLKFGVVF